VLDFSVEGSFLFCYLAYKENVMSVSRRTFIELSFKTAAVISVANGLSSFSAESFTLPVKESIKLRFAIASDGH